jgi:hypothetical protein
MSLKIGKLVMGQQTCIFYGQVQILTIHRCALHYLLLYYVRSLPINTAHFKHMSGLTSSTSVPRRFQATFPTKSRPDCGRHHGLRLSCHLCLGQGMEHGITILTCGGFVSDKTMYMYSSPTKLFT